MAAGDRNDPYRAFNYVVDIENSPVAGFSEVSGLSAEGDSVPYREGNYAENSVLQLPGLRKYTNVTLKRGYTQSNALWAWYAAIAAGERDWRAVTITLMDEAHEPVLRFDLEAAWINKIEGPAFNASGNEVAIETMELVHQKLTFALVS